MKMRLGIKGAALVSACVLLTVSGCSKSGPPDGKLAQENAALRAENEILKKELAALKENQAMPAPPPQAAPSSETQKTPIQSLTEQMRAETREAQKRTCWNRLRILSAAEIQWSIEKSKAGGAEYTLADLAPYLKRPLECPNGGVYTFGKLDRPVSCSIHGQIP